MSQTQLDTTIIPECNGRSSHA